MPCLVERGLELLLEAGTDGEDGMLECAVLVGVARVVVLQVRRARDVAAEASEDGDGLCRKDEPALRTVGDPL